MTNELTEFNYGQLDAGTAAFLEGKESNMREIVGRAYTELGRELTEARDKLAGSRYNGVFIKWLAHMNYPQRTAYNLIDRYAELQLLQSGKEVETFEALPATLTYLISAPSAESTPAKAQAKSEVIAGEHDTPKAYKERIAELEAAAQKSDARAKQAESQADVAIRSEGIMREKLDDIEGREPVVVEVEVIPEEIPQRMRELEADNKQMDRSLASTYERNATLEKLERTVRSQEESPMYDLIRSLQTTNRYFDTFTARRGFLDSAIASAEQSTVDLLETQLRRAVAKAEEVLADKPLSDAEMAALDVLKQATADGEAVNFKRLEEISGMGEQSFQKHFRKSHMQAAYTNAGIERIKRSGKYLYQRKGAI